MGSVIYVEEHWFSSLGSIGRAHPHYFAGNTRLQLGRRNHGAIRAILENIHEQFRIAAVQHRQLVTAVFKIAAFLIWMPPFAGDRA